MKARVKPINLAAIEVKGLLAGKRTQLRRALKVQPFKEKGAWNVFFSPRDGGHVRYRDERALMRGYTSMLLPRCHKPGTVLWVREAWGVQAPTNGVIHYAYRADGNDTVELVDGWRAPHLMPLEAVRLYLQVVATRLQRISRIDDAGVAAEGCTSRAHFQAQWNLSQEQLGNGQGHTGIFSFKEDPVVVNYAVKLLQETPP